MHSFFELRHFLKGEKLCLTTVDTIFKEDEFKNYIKAFEQDQQLDGFMAVTDFIDDEKPLYVEVNEDLSILNFHDAGGLKYKYISGGIYCLKQNAIGILEQAIASDISRMRNFQRLLVKEGLKLRAYPFSKIIDVDHAEDIEKAECFLNDK